MHARQLPLLSGIELLRSLGVGRRCEAFLGLENERQVVVKIYTPRAVAKYRQRHGVEIAQLEYERNRAFHMVASLRPHVAAPLRVLAMGAQAAPAFVQQYVPGRSLESFLIQHGALPPGVLERGRAIVRAAGAAGLFDLDINAANVILRQESGQLIPTLFDFNLVPQHRTPPNPFLALSYRLGLRRREHRDLRSLRDWERIAAAHARVALEIAPSEAGS